VGAAGYGGMGWIAAAVSAQKIGHSVADIAAGSGDLA
jgi:hypothetical protein